MKSVFMIAILLVLSACSIQYESEEVSSESEKVGQAVQQPIVKSETTFADNVLENEHFILKIEHAEVIKSPAEFNPGLFVTFSLTNKSDSEELLPIDTLLWLEVEQNNDTSRNILNSNYHFLDAFGDDTESYNEMVRKSNERDNYLLPGKTIEIIEAYELNNLDYPVLIKGLDYETFEEVGSYSIELPQESNISQESTVSSEEIIDNVVEEPYEVIEDEEEYIPVVADSSEAIAVLNNSGFSVTDTGTELIATPLSSGISQAIWMAMQNDDADGYIANAVHPVFTDVSTYSAGKSVSLYSYEGDLILTAEQGSITYSVIY